MHAQELRNDIPQRRRFDRPGDHPAVASIGGHLAEQVILDSTPYDVDGFQGIAKEILEPL